MGSRKSFGKKKRLMKFGRRTKWAPFWLIPKIFGKGRRVHPSRINAHKRRWNRDRIID